jgi:hypothetical protein
MSEIFAVDEGGVLAEGGVQYSTMTTDTHFYRASRSKFHTFNLCDMSNLHALASVPLIQFRFESVTCPMSQHLKALV